MLKDKIMLLTPKLGIRKNTVKKVPTMLPTVATKYKFPAILPSLSILFTFNLIANGETIPKSTVGIKKENESDY